MILAGGRARRLGGADKPGIAIGGRTLVATAVGAAVAAGTHQVIVVGPPRPELITEKPATAVEFTCEDPAGCGPVPAVRAGLDLVTEPWLVLLAGDMPFLREQHLQAILRAARQSGGAMMIDDTGRPQWLASCWRTTDLRRALTTYSGDSLRGLLEPRRGVPVLMPPEPGEPAPWLDCDTPADLTAARDWAQRTSAGNKEGRSMSTLQNWTEAACAELGIDPASVDQRAILDLAREVAHRVDRPAAPLTAYLIGVAVGAGQPFADAAELLTSLAARWESEVLPDPS